MRCQMVVDLQVKIRGLERDISAQHTICGNADNRGQFRNHLHTCYKSGRIRHEEADDSGNKKKKMLVAHSQEKKENVEMFNADDL